MGETRWIKKKKINTKKKGVIYKISIEICALHEFKKSKKYNKLNKINK